jgi:hypothetical protein
MPVDYVEHFDERPRRGEDSPSTDPGDASTAASSTRSIAAAPTTYHRPRGGNHELALLRETNPVDFALPSGQALIALRVLADDATHP